MILSAAESWRRVMTQLHGGLWGMWFGPVSPSQPRIQTMSCTGTRPSHSSADKGPAWREAEAYGFDMSLIESNLRLSPRERIRRHNRALRTAISLREAVKKRDARH